MTTKYAIWIGESEVRYFDADRQQSYGFPPLIGEVRKPPMLMWPLADIDVATTEWDDALEEFSIEERKVAKVRVVAD